jgi:hypothetical protein
MTPPLEFDKLEPGFGFAPVRLRVTRSMLRAYELVVGEERRSSLAVPPALLAVLARRAYLGRGTMPAGAVLLKQSLSWERVAWVGEELYGRATVLERSELGSRRAVVLRSVLRAADGSLLGTTTAKLGWPAA